jgi:hypothetical protein
MSTITDAVEKKKHEDEDHKPKAIDLDNPPIVAIPRDRRKFRRLKILIILLIFASAAGGAGYLYREELGTYLGTLIARFVEKQPQTPASVDKTGTVEEATKAVVPDEKKTDEKIIEKKEEPVVEEFPRLVISGIIFDPLDPEAIINGQSVKTGETIEGAYIVEIQKDRVRIRFKGEERVLTYR